MSPHIGDELAALLAGELSPADTAAVLRHAQTCPQCTQALHGSLRAHIALTRASRLLRRIPAASAGPPETAADLPPLPVTRQPRLRLRAAAVALAAGTAISTYVLTKPATATQPATVAAGTLSPVAGGSAPAAAHGTVVMVSLGPAARQMTITISGLPPAGRGHFYEAWLLQPASGKMLPVGVLLTPGSPVSYRLPATLTLGYSYVDISRQADDGDPAHSADSVLRAQLRA
jgi:anti-sigma factor RsiW